MKEALLQVLHELGITVIGQTPSLAPSKTRSQEIESFLACARGTCEVTHWAALDDMDLVQQHREGTRGMKECNPLRKERGAFADHFVKCDMEHGLTQREADTAIHILLGSSEPPHDGCSSSCTKAGNGLLEALAEEDDGADCRDY
jgi:hypothetical protein